MRPYPCTFEEVARLDLARLEVLSEGDWDKERTFGEAHYGRVFGARATAQGRRRGLPETFALKAMSMRDVLEGAHGLESGLNELHAAIGMKKFKLPFVGKVLFVARDDLHFYIGTEPCPHGELLNGAGGFKAEDKVRDLAKQLLQGLATLHFLGIAHRDVSLENLLVATDGDIRIIDFAQAIMVHAPCEPDSEARVPRSDAGIPGKAYYRPPEMFLGAGDYSAKKLDIFQAGVALFAVAADKYPFKAGEVWLGGPWRELASGGCACIGKRLRDSVPDASPDLQDFLGLLLAPDPDKRLTAKEALEHPWLAGDRARPPEGGPAQ